MYGCQAWHAQEEFVEQKLKHSKDILVETPFLNHDGSLYKIAPITFSFIDSITRWTTKAFEDKFGGLDIGGSDNNMKAMARSRDQATLMERISVAASKGTHYILGTMHMGKVIDVGGGPPGMQPDRQLGSMKPGEKLMGGGGTALYLPLTIMATSHSKPLMDKDQQPLYGRPNQPVTEGRNESDLHTVTVRPFRSKAGPGYEVELVVSQRNGYSPELTYLHFIRDNLLKSEWANGEYYGTRGGFSNFKLCLYPDVSMTRNSAYGKLKEDRILFRALEITCELIQLRKSGHFHKLYIPPDEIYSKLVEQGYDVKRLLNSRGWWTYDNYNPDILPYLSVVDLLEVAHGIKKPYWWDNVNDKQATDS